MDAQDRRADTVLLVVERYTVDADHGLEREPEAMQARVAVRIARGEPTAAALLLTRRLDELGWTSLLAAPLLAQLVEARLLEGSLDGATAAASALEQIAATRRRERVEALADGFSWPDRPQPKDALRPPTFCSKR